MAACLAVLLETRLWGIPQVAITTAGALVLMDRLHTVDALPGYVANAVVTFSVTMACFLQQTLTGRSFYLPYVPPPSRCVAPCRAMPCFERFGAKSRRPVSVGKTATR